MGTGQSMRQASQATGKRRVWSKRFWGRVAYLSPVERVAALAFVVAAIVAMSFCQLGFWPIGMIEAKPVYLMLLLGPLLLGSLMFGSIIGGLLGLFAGCVVFLHAQLFPLDYYEVYFMTPLNTFVLLTVLGFVAGWLFSFALGRAKSPGARAIAIALICTAISFVVSSLVLVNTVIMYGGVENIQFIREYLFSTPLGVVVQALVDAAFVILLCFANDMILRAMRRRESERTLLSVFRNWLLIVSSIVFMVASAVVFSYATDQAVNEAGKNMDSEVSYLKKQLEKDEDGNFDSLLDGYEPELDGYVLITDKDGVILATDDEERYPKGAFLVQLLDYDVGAFGEAGGAALLFDSIAEDDEVTMLQGTNEKGEQTMDFVFAAAASCGDKYAIMLRAPDMVYANRFGTMLALSLFAVLLLAAICIVAAKLLDRVVVRRIDETNESLSKITHGNLSERVHVKDTREFNSLAGGINTTVSALKDTIDEVKQRNAQDLATAKTIQESVLPREFPPFPHIDKFDIYASMKTAKEVGGDFYDFFLIGDDNEKLGFIMADVSGKGISAALFMMTAKTQIRNYMEADLPVDEAVNAANHQLCIGNDAGMFVTAWIGVLDYNTGKLSYVNAGHNPPLLLRDGAWEWIKNVSGMPLGLFDGIPYDSYDLELQPSNMLYLYTDGVTEAMDANGQMFDEKRLEKTLVVYQDMNPRSVGVGVRRAITDFTKDAEQSDDITMLILKYGVPPEKRAVMVLPADDKQLVHVCNFIHEELHRRNAPNSVRNPFDIAAEELFVNVCHYAYPNATPEEPGEVRISFEYESNPPSLTVQIADDGIPYDPLAKPDAVTPDNIMDVPIGGLGILMAKRSVDEMSYERIDGSNVLTFKKGW